MAKKTELLEFLHDTYITANSQVIIDNYMLQLDNIDSLKDLESDGLVQREIVTNVRGVNKNGVSITISNFPCYAITEKGKALLPKKKVVHEESPDLTVKKVKKK